MKKSCHFFSAHRNSSCAVVSNTVSGVNAWTVQPCSRPKAYVCSKPEGMNLLTFCHLSRKYSTTFFLRVYEYNIRFMFGDYISHIIKSSTKSLYEELGV